MDTLILSTKKLTSSQRELLLNSGLRFVEYDAIAITPLNFEAPKEVENAIFTSKNAVTSILFRDIQIENCFCVGEKTKTLLEENGYKVTKSAKNSTELAHFISKIHTNEAFLYFCGKERLDALPNILKTEKIIFSEIKTYKTDLKLKKFEQKWDGILFFSPSGVESYFSSNPTLEEDVAKCHAFCIGETTATAAKKYTDRVITANTTSVESVIAKTVKTLKTNDD
ncbi:MAG: uroporphyrinogen-III synthase [Bacteroidota bacterium]